MIWTSKIHLPHAVYLLRHGETEWNREGRIQGQMDSALTDLGRAQAVRQGQTLRHIRDRIGPHLIVCSPLQRAQTTARLALGSNDYFIEPRISEIGCGRWENTTHEQRLERDPDIASGLREDFDRYTHAPEGEGLDSLAARLREFLGDLDVPAIVFSHKIALVVMRALLCAEDTNLSSTMAPPQGSVLEVKDGIARQHA